MQKVYNEYKGVILFFAVIVLMTNILIINNKRINTLEQTSINTYEK